MLQNHSISITINNYSSDNEGDRENVDKYTNINERVRHTVDNDVGWAGEQLFLFFIYNTNNSTPLAAYLYSVIHLREFTSLKYISVPFTLSTRAHTQILRENEIWRN